MHRLGLTRIQIMVQKCAAHIIYQQLAPRPPGATAATTTTATTTKQEEEDAARRAALRPLRKYAITKLH